MENNTPERTEVLLRALRAAIVGREPHEVKAEIFSMLSEAAEHDRLKGSQFAIGIHAVVDTFRDAILNMDETVDRVSRTLQQSHNLPKAERLSVPEVLSRIADLIDNIDYSTPLRIVAQDELD